MRKLLLIAGIVLLCLPMLFVSWLFLAANARSLDASTMRLPGGLRSAVAEVVMQRAGYGKKSLPAADRALKLDPENAQAWERRCQSVTDGNNDLTDLHACQRAARLDDTALNHFWLGKAQEFADDPCAAEDSYTRASSRNAANAFYTYVESMGRAALHCGHLPAARAGFETALTLEEKELKSGDDEADELADLRTVMLTDRENLIIIYHRMHEDALASQTCGEAHPDWKVCSCDLDSNGKAVCHKGQGT